MPAYRAVNAALQGAPRRGAEDIFQCPAVDGPHGRRLARPTRATGQVERVVYQRYAYWCDKGHFERLLQGVQQPDTDEVMVDSTCCRAHQSSAGARKSSGAQAIGITRGGRNTKIHTVCDALGNPLRFVLTAGQRHDSKPVPELLYGLAAKALVADKACDSDKIVQSAQAQGMQVIIPCKVNRKKQRALDRSRYMARHLVENLFQRMRVFRRVATRYDKLDVTFLGFVHIAGIMKWLH